MQASAHLEIARQFLAASDDYSVNEAPFIKSEMLWCAAAHCVKAAANQYGWANVSHDDLFRVVRRLTRNLSEPRLQQSFYIASRLHKNMYEGDLSTRDVGNYAAAIRRFANRMAGILRDHPQLP